MSSEQKEKEREITLNHNKYKIKIKINNDFEKTKEIIKKKLYFQDKDLNKFTLYYYDDDHLECDIDEDSFEEAFAPEITEWGLRSNLNEEEEEEIPSDKKINENLEQLQDMKEKVKKRVNEVQKEVNEKVQKIKNELIAKFTKIMNEKISDINKKYEEKIKKLEEINKSLCEKNKIALEQMEKANESSMNNIINNISKYAEDKIGKQIDDYNKDFTENLERQITSSKIQINEEKKKINEKIEELTEKQNNMTSTMEKSKACFRNLFSSIVKKS